jgi:glutamine synthetase
MPKPDSGRTGSGMHFHLSIGDRENDNLFQDDSDKNGMGLSRLGYHFIGGLLQHAPALCAFAAPTVNSYKRLVVGRSLSGSTWAPAYIGYGDNNRSAMIRVPYGHLEFRLPDSGCNPYLVHAAMIAAGMDGVERELDPGDPMNINFYQLDRDECTRRGIGILPQNLDAAINALERDALFSDVMGEDIVGEFIRVKRMEWNEYSRHVSDWEVEHYAEFF